MSEKLNRKVADVTLDGLVDAAYANKSCGVTVASGQGVLKRGTVLGVNSSGKCVILGTTETVDSKSVKCEARYILNKDVDATDADAVAIAYEEGRFIKQHLIVKDEYTMTADDIDALRVHNIGLADQL